MKNAKREVVLFRMGDPAQEGPGALLLGGCKELLRGCLLHHHAVFHEHGLGGNVAGKAHLVGDHQHGHALFGQLPHHAEHLAGQLRVKGAGGLVKVNNFRVGGKGTGDRHPLLLSAGKLAGVVVGTVCKAYLGQHLHADFLCLLLGQFTRHNQPLGHILQGSLVAEQVVVLEHKGGLFAQPGNVGAAGMGKVEAFAVKHQLPGISSLQKIQAPQQGGPGAAKSGSGGSMANNALYSLVENELNKYTRKTGFTFGVDSYNTDENTTRTDYTYQFSKQFFNDRIRVKIGGRISTDNNENQSNNIEDNLVDDISIEYVITKKRNLFLKVFRHSNYESVLDGEVTQTGVGIVWRKNFRKFKDLFKNNRKSERETKTENQK